MHKGNEEAGMVLFVDGLVASRAGHARMDFQGRGERCIKPALPCHKHQ